MSLRADQITIERGARAILRDASLTLTAGELTVLVGPNGAGKSTLLCALAGDERPGAGAVSLDGRPLAEYALDDLARLRAVLGAPPRLAFNFTVRDVLAMGWMHGERHGPAVFEQAMASILDACELTALAGRVYMTLSAGEKQRAEYARACMQLWQPVTDAAPRWLLLDEPTANLDVAHGVALLEALRARVRAGDGVLAVLHDLDLAARFADRVVLLCDGCIVANGLPQEVLTAQRLSAVYRTPIHVEHHAALQRLVVIG